MALPTRKLTTVEEDAEADPLMPLAPPELAGRTSDEPTIIRWVANNVDANPDPETCPAPFAWTLLRACRAHPGFLAIFLEKCWVKLIPSKAQLEAGGPKVQDGRSVIELTDRILAHAQEAQGRHRTALLASPPEPRTSAFESFDPRKETAP